MNHAINIQILLRKNNRNCGNSLVDRAPNPLRKADIHHLILRASEQILDVVEWIVRTLTGRQAICTPEV